MDFGGYKLSTKELNQFLVPVDEEGDGSAIEPMSPLEIRTACKSLLGRYLDPKDHEIDEDYINNAFNVGLMGGSEKAKLGFNMHAEGTKGKFGLTTEARKGMEQMLHDWAGAASMPLGGGYVEKDVLDSTISGNNTGGVLINQTVIPELSVWFNAAAPLIRYLPVAEANGLQYQWNNIIALGDPATAFLDENGCPTNSKGQYFRGATDVALMAIQRATSIKLDLAIRAGGVLYNNGMSAPELEMQNAMAIRGRLYQMCVVGGTTATGHDGLTDEFGHSFTNGFNGLEVLLSFNANTVHSNYYPAGFTPIIEEATGTTTPITLACRRAITRVRNFGGAADLAIMTYSMADRLAAEQIPQLRMVQNTGGQPTFSAGVIVDSIAHPGGPCPILALPDSAFPTYLAANIGQPVMNGVTPPATALTGTVQSVFILSLNSLVSPFLGLPEPLPIEIPVGIPAPDGTGCFSRKFIVYMFRGFTARVPVHNAKVRVKIA